MKKKFFGTDGVRGRVGEYPITPELIMHLGYSAGKVLASADWHLSRDENPGVLIGKDTRISGYLLESALQAGLIAAGVDVYLAGPGTNSRSSLFNPCITFAGGYCDFRFA